MSCGKKVSQGSHASLKAYRKNSDKQGDDWLREGGKKVALSVDKKTMIEMFQMAKDEGLTAAMVEDAGMTEINPGTKTAVAIGPDTESRIDEITGDLKLMK